MQIWCSRGWGLGYHAVHGRGVRDLSIFHRLLTNSGGHCPSGYHKSTKNIITAARKIIRAIKTEIPELYVLGNPPSSVVAFGPKEGSDVNILKVGDAMSKKGWHLNALQNPTAMHIVVTVRDLPIRTLCFPLTQTIVP